MLTLVLTSCVTLGKSHTFRGPWFLLVQLVIVVITSNHHYGSSTFCDNLCTKHPLSHLILIKTCEAGYFYIFTNEETAQTEVK
jgi:hypothetical protein